GERNRDRGFSGAADGEVADTQHRNVDLLALRIGHAAACYSAVNRRCRVERIGAPVRRLPPEGWRFACHQPFPPPFFSRDFTISGWMKGSSARKVRSSAPRISSTAAAPAAIMSRRASWLLRR